jgi:L-ascorbate metabolism protein UlaG (beta-lactamase superfamily)
VEITWLGHSCFKIKGSKTVIITDPFPPDLGYSLGKLTADIVTVSHQHPSHSYVQGVGGQPRKVQAPGEYEISDALIIGVATFHDAEGGKKRGKNTVYLMDIDGMAVCHLGDLGQALNNAQVEEIGNVDVLLLPVGGFSTIDAAAAAAIIRQLEPKIVIPMHYKTPAIKMELDPVERFLKEMGKEQVETKPKLSVTKTTMPLTTQIILLSYQS